MADKAFGVKQLNILGSGTPSIESPSDLNLNANKVAISTNLTVGGASTFTGNISANGNINANGNIIGDNATNISGINSVTATNFFGNISGVGATFTNITGTLQTAAQTNITSVGTLGALTVSGNINANGNIIGDGSTNIHSINNVSASTLNATIQTVAQPNITSLGTLTSLNVSGDVSIGGTLTYDDVTNIDSVGLITARTGIRVLSGGINAVGVVTATSFSGDGSNLTGITTAGITTSTDASFAQVEWDVVNNGASAYRFTGPGNDGTEDNPDLYLVRGQRYVFNVNASGHPFLIRSSNGVTYSDGVINNGAAVGKVILNLQHDAPARLFYQCSAHSGMIGNIYVVGGDQVISGVVTATSFSGTLTTAAQPNITSLGTLSSLTVSGDINANGNIVGDNSTNITNFNSITATSFSGDGSALTDAGEIKRDAKCNIFMRGICSGCNLDLTFGTGAHFNIMIGECSGRNMTCGDDNILMGRLTGRNITTGSENIFLGRSSGCCTVSGCMNVGVGCFTLNKNTGNYNVALGSNAGQNNEGGSYNLFLGCGAGLSNTTGGRNIAIGRDVCLPSASGNDQLAIGCGANRWIAGDSSYNVTLAGIATVYASGIVSATKFCGDGSALTGLAGFSPDAQENLYAGTGAGCCSDSDTCFNVAIGACAGLCLNEGDENVFLGSRAGQQVTSGGCNVFLGKCAGIFDSTGCLNIAIGCGAMGADTVTGRRNIVFGQCAGYLMTSGQDNILMGLGAGCCMCRGSGNIVMGVQAGQKLDGASISNNVILGYRAGCGIAGGTSVSNNIFLGQYAAPSVTNDVRNNIIMGRRAGKCITTADNNIFLGMYAGCRATGGCNIYFGCGAGGGSTNVTGTHNIAMGFQVTVPDATGSCQLAIGNGSNRWIVGNSDFNVGIGTTNPNAPVGAGNTNKLSVGIVSAYQLYGDGSNLSGVGFSPDSQENLVAGGGAGAAKDADTCFNIMLGCNSGAALNEGDNNVLIGKCSGEALTSGSSNVLLGHGAGCNLTTAASTVIIGTEAGRRTTSQDNSIMIGREAGSNYFGGNGGSVMIGRAAGKGVSCNTGDRNTFIGTYAGQNNCSGSYNTFIGESAGAFAGVNAGGIYIQSCCNVAIGYEAGKNVRGKWNISIGYASGHKASGSTSSTCSSGAGNIVMGYHSGRSLTTGQYNQFFGTYSAKCVSSGSGNISLGYCAGENITTGSYNVAIGHNVDPASATGDTQLAIGCGSSKWITGDSSFNVCLAGSTIKAMASGGAVCATTFYGDGSNLTGITAAGTGAIGGLTIKDEGSVVGTAGSVSTINFVGGSVVAIASSGAAGVATITVSGFAPDAEGNLVAGTCAGSSLSGGGICNVLIGQCAGKSVTGGDRNVLIGLNAGCSFTSGGCNIAIGPDAGKSAGSSSYQNIAIGIAAMQGGSGSIDNISIGRNAGPGILAGSANYHNFMGGYYAGSCYSGARCNIVIGLTAHYEGTSACHTIALGQNVMKCQTTGDYNIAFGKSALEGSSTKASNTGSNNIAIGKKAGALATSGGNNILLGQCTGYNVSSGGANVFLGRNAGCTITTGSKNIAIGCNVQLQSVTDSCQLAIGAGTNHWIVGNSDFNVGIGTTNPNAPVGSGWQHHHGFSNTAKLSVGIVSSYQLYGRLQSDSLRNVIIGEGAHRCGYQNSSTAVNSCNNVSIGYSAGHKMEVGDHNTFVGTNAGRDLCGDSILNVFVGMGAGMCAGKGSVNTGIGAYSLRCVCNASDLMNNSALGYNSGKCLLDGIQNTILGSNSGCSIINGSQNVLIGYQVDVPVTNGSRQLVIGSNNYNSCRNYWIVGNDKYNVGIGTTNPDAPVGAGNTNKLSVGILSAYQLYGDGSNLTGISGGGLSADSDRNLFASNTCSACNFSGATDNVLFGQCAGKCITSGDNNIALGCRALCKAEGASDNIAMGLEAGQSITSGLRNIFIGKTSGTNLSTGCENIAIGCKALGTGVVTGNNNISIGQNSGNCLNNADNNILLGCCAGNQLTTGSKNVAIGLNAAASGTITGSRNAAIGENAALCLSGGFYNVMFGFNAGKCIQTGGGNVAIGACAGLKNTGQGGNTFVGTSAGCNSTGSCNTFIGQDAGRHQGGYSHNTYIGHKAACSQAQGDNNVAIGHNVCLPTSTGNRASKQLAIGHNSKQWIVGNCDYNVGIGTTNPNAAVGAGNTAKLSVGILSAYQLYGDGSNLTGISGGGGLSHWTESANTSSPNNVVAANRLIATGAGTTIDAVIQPKSTGAFLTNLPDGAAAGGNKRGCYAVDLQMKRSGAGCVAAHNFATISGGENNYSDSTHAAIGGGYGNCAGWNAAVAGGYNNKAGGNAGAVGGGYGNCAGYMSFVGGGQYNAASATYSSVLGGGSNTATGMGAVNIASYGSKADGERSTVMGHNACTRNRDGSIAIGAHCGLANSGKAQYSIMNLGRSTTDATQTVLNSRSSSCAAGNDNQLTIPTNAAYVFCGSVIANVTSGGDTHGWLFRGVMKRGSGNASLVGTPSIDDVAYDSGASAWSIALGVDTTNQALAVCVTGQASTNITWVATVHATELQH